MFVVACMCFVLLTFSFLSYSTGSLENYLYIVKNSLPLRIDSILVYHKSCVHVQWIPCAVNKLFRYLKSVLSMHIKWNTSFFNWLNLSKLAYGFQCPAGIWCRLITQTELNYWSGYISYTNRLGWLQSLKTLLTNIEGIKYIIKSINVSWVFLH